MAMNQAIMEIYKQEGINPAGNLLSCLPLMPRSHLGRLVAGSPRPSRCGTPFDGWWIRICWPVALIPWPGHQYPHYLDSSDRPYRSPTCCPSLGISQLLQMKFMPRGSLPAMGRPRPAAQQMSSSAR